MGTRINMGFLTKKINLRVQGNEPRFLGHPAQNLVTVVTELFHYDVS
jgi:hypothetical protein